MELKKGKIYTGAGAIEYKDERIGTVSKVYFTLAKLGIKGDERGAIYGTIDGKIDRTGLLPELNSPEPTPVDLRVKIDGGEDINLKGMLVIDQIPRSGEMRQTEFHGPNPAQQE